MTPQINSNKMDASPLSQWQPCMEIGKTEAANHQPRTKTAVIKKSITKLIEHGPTAANWSQVVILGRAQGSPISEITGLSERFWTLLDGVGLGSGAGAGLELVA